MNSIERDWRSKQQEDVLRAYDALRAEGKTHLQAVSSDRIRNIRLARKKA